MSRVHLALLRSLPLQQQLLIAAGGEGACDGAGEDAVSRGRRAGSDRRPPQRAVPAALAPGACLSWGLQSVFPAVWVQSPSWALSPDLQRNYVRAPCTCVRCDQLQELISGSRTQEGLYHVALRLLQSGVEVSNLLCVWA